MKITKKYSTTYDIKFWETTEWNITMGKFIESRKKLGMRVLDLEKCFICNKKFKDDEIPIVITVIGKGNKFSCKECAIKYKE